MEILLVAATTFEIQPTIDYIRGRAGRDGFPSVTSLITGVGGLATTWALTRQIDSARPDLVIQAGIAGCLAGKQPGEVFVVGDEVLADLGVWEDETFKSLFEMGLADKDAFPFVDGKLVNPHKALLALTALPVVRAITVNEITTDRERIRWHQQNTGAVVESMEGGPLHYVCLQARVPFLQLRAVSNEVGVRDKTRWDIPLAIARLNSALISLLEKLDKHEIFPWLQPLPE
ncbi:futalosine hydrolase [Puia dinghuensis]|uniref:Futalosine hydrolase n=1 Tax=Puia dinghuensis TaxID=1792502 RepID=A0A8J2UIJ8_9BACT|nr:futalosine hydrolase [Puia dinghuensis]GGB22646.1 Futalosine hydrolase [Puia dinghuensis]